jgi:hypothetical protein
MMINGREAGWPTCARCNAPVDRLEQDRDLARDCIVVRVFHHGEAEEIFLAPQLLEGLPAGETRFEFGEAFAQRALTSRTEKRA